MRCSKCQKSISANDRFCRFCGEPVTLPPPETPLPYQHRGISFPIELNDFGAAEIRAQMSSPSDLGWGAHLYTGASKDSQAVKTRPDDCLAWMESGDWHCWFRRGLVVWDSNAQSIGTLLAAEALDLLNRLRDSGDRQTEGIAIVEQHKTWLVLNEPAKGNSGRKKKGATHEAPPELPEQNQRFYKKERLRLRGQAAEEFLAYLLSIESLLKEMAAEEAKLQEIVDKRIFEVQIQMLRRIEISQFDPKSWKLPWTHQDNPPAFICNFPPDRATIRLAEDGFRWQVVIEQPGYSKWDWQRFIDLAKAMTWVEKELPRLREEKEKAAKERERAEAEALVEIAALPSQDLTPYWIPTEALEPERISYRVIIDLEYAPFRSTKEEISFGEIRHSDKEFYSPAAIVRELNLNRGQVKVQQTASFLGLYQIHSLVTYHDAPLVAAQAQQIWDQCAIGERFVEKKVEWAEYGFQEVDTCIVSTRVRLETGLGT